MARNSVQHWGGWLSIAGVVGFVAIVVGLNLVQHDYDARYDLMSELALGSHGDAMILAFAFFAVSVMGAQQGLGSVAGSVWLRTILVIAALSLLGAGIFPLGRASDLHIALVAFAFVLLVLAMYLLPSQAPGLTSPLVRGVSWALAAATALSVFAGHSLLPMGIGQRLAAGSVLLWLCFLGWQLIRRSGSRN
jgi:hypothetical protein